jgi:polynucleotide 5'-kinase involved in rRNA processing
MMIEKMKIKAQRGREERKERRKEKKRREVEQLLFTHTSSSEWGLAKSYLFVEEFVKDEICNTYVYCS